MKSRKKLTAIRSSRTHDVCKSIGSMTIAIVMLSWLESCDLILENTFFSFFSELLYDIQINNISIYVRIGHYRYLQVVIKDILDYSISTLVEQKCFYFRAISNYRSE